MLRYFVAANFWLFVTALTYVGKTPMRSQPDMYAVFGAGRWFEDHAYTAVIYASLVVAAIHFVLWLVTAMKNNRPETIKTVS